MKITPTLQYIFGPKITDDIEEAAGLPAYLFLSFSGSL
jgi:hypothetical protein